MTHFPGHQQALIKDELVLAVLSFEKHDDELFENTFSKFDYDNVVDLCDIQKDATIGSFWNGTDFLVQPYPSWELDSSKIWQPPVPKPEVGEFFWNEESLSWLEIELPA